MTHPPESSIETAGRTASQISLLQMVLSCQQVERSIHPSRLQLTLFECPLKSIANSWHCVGWLSRHGCSCNNCQIDPVLQRPPASYTGLMIAGSILRQITRNYPLNRPRRRILEMLPDVAADNGEFSIKSGLRLRAYPGGTTSANRHIGLAILILGWIAAWRV